MIMMALSLPLIFMPWSEDGRTAMLLMRYRRCDTPASGVVDESAITGGAVLLGISKTSD